MCACVLKFRKSLKSCVGFSVLMPVHIEEGNLKVGKIRAYDVNGSILSLFSVNLIYSVKQVINPLAVDAYRVECNNCRLHAK